ncbi:MAG: hypothetical protein H8D62_00695, partial [Bacteroidetes bacterium]|nr:hypothetical protein [Bacteroidota bacterium]
DFFEKVEAEPQADYENVVGQDSINRFDSKRKSGGRKKGRGNNRNSRNNKGRHRKPKAKE